MCLSNYIGIRGCSQDAPESGLYINDVPGITTRLAANIVDSEIFTGEQLLQRNIDNGYVYFLQDLLAGLAARGYVWRGHSLVYNGIGDVTSEVLAAGTEHRIETDLCDAEKATLQTVTLDASGIGTVDINGTEYDVQLGTNELVVNLDVTDGIEIVADVDLKFYTISSSCLCGTRTPGLFEITVTCDECYLLTKYRHMFKRAYQLRAAIDFFQYAMTTEQESQEARHAKEIAGRMLAQLRGGIDRDGIQFKGEYKQVLDGLINSFVYEAKKLHCCFECEGYVLSYTKL